MSPRPLEAGTSVEVALRGAVSRCDVLAFLTSSDEPRLTDELRSGLADLFAEFAHTVRAVQRALPASALNIDIPSQEDVDE